MQEYPLVSIAVAIFNAENYIGKCIDSILAQTYKNIEVILVNDGSTDRSLEKCISYADSRINIINKPNEGLSTARQAGLDNALGEYICFVDADDRLDCRYVEDMLKNITDQCADICVCGVLNTDLQGNEKELKFAFHTQKIDTESLCTNFCKCILTFGMSDSWNKMYRVAFLKDNQATFHMPKGLNGSDKLFNHELILYEPVVTHTHSVLYYHISRSFSMVNRKRKRLDITNEIIYNSLISIIAQRGIKGMENQMTKLYSYGLRRAFQDAYNAVDSKDERQKEFNDMRRRSVQFCDNSNICLSARSMLPDKAIMLFIFLLKRQYGLEWYCALRKKLRKV